MRANTASISWAAVVCPGAAYLFPTSNELEINRRDQIHRLFQTEFDCYLPIIKTTLWGKQIRFQWTENILELQVKIATCLHRAGVMLGMLNGMDAEWLGYKMSAGAAILHDECIPLTEEMLKLLAASGNNAESVCHELVYLNQIGTTLTREVCELIWNNQNNLKRVRYIFEALHKIRLVPTNDELNALVSHKDNIAEICGAIHALEYANLSLTKEIWELLINVTGYAKELRLGIWNLSKSPISLPGEIVKLFIGNAAQLRNRILVLRELNHARLSLTLEDLEYLAMNVKDPWKFKSAISYLRSTEIPITKELCKLLIASGKHAVEMCYLISELYSINFFSTHKDVSILTLLSERARTIRLSLQRFREAGFPMRCEDFLLLSADKEFSEEVEKQAGNIIQTMKRALAAKIPILPEDLKLLIMSAKHSSAIGWAIAHLYQNGVQLERNDFELLVAKGAYAKEISFAINHLLKIGFPLTKKDCNYLSINGENAKSLSSALQLLYDLNIPICEEIRTFLLTNAQMPIELCYEIQLLSKAGIPLTHKNLTMLAKANENQTEKMSDAIRHLSITGLLTTDNFNTLAADNGSQVLLFDKIIQSLNKRNRLNQENLNIAFSDIKRFHSNLHTKHMGNSFTSLRTIQYNHGDLCA